MKKNIIIVALLILSGLFAWKYYSHRNTENAVDSSSQPRPVRSSPLTIKSLQSQPIAAEELRTQAFEAAPTTEGEIPPESNLPPVECTSQWDRISTLSLDQILADLVTGAIEVDLTCRKHEPDTAFVKNFYDVCAYERREHRLRDEAACAKALAAYRMNWIDRLTAGRTDYEAMSLPLLMNKIMAKFSDAELKPEEKAQTIEMVETLIEREPEFFAARKALVASLMPGLGSNPEVLERISTAAENALQLNPDDTELQEVQLLTAQVSGRREQIDQFVASHPESPLGYYYRAASSMKNGDQAAAMEDLNRAIELAPGEERFKTTLAKIEQDAEGSHFEMKIGFRFDNL